MGYSTSRKTLQARLPDLEQLQAGEMVRWNLAPGVSARDFAYAIREALYIATLYPDEYPKLAEAQANFRIQIVNQTTVQAVYKPIKARSVVSTVTVHGLEGAERGPTTLAGELDAAKIIQAWHNTQPSNTPMTFPQANLDREELLKLYRWAEARTPRWLMMVADDGKLTLTPYTRDLDGLGWDPTDE